jgi:hypothetical protein
MFQQSESLTQHQSADDAKTSLFQFSPNLGQKMFSVSEWSKMDEMMSLGIKSYVDSVNSPRVTVPATMSSTSEGTIQALACVLSMPINLNTVFGNTKSIFPGMNGLALENLLNELVSGMQSKIFEVAASALQILGHWTATKQGICVFVKLSFFSLFLVLKHNSILQGWSKSSKSERKGCSLLYKG